MTDQTTESAERVSALVDGQLHGDEFLQALAELESNAQARSNWDTFHLLGDVMRSGASDVRVHDPEFVARLRQRMVKEVPDFAPIPGISTAVEDHFNPPRATSANDGSWRRVAGLASVVLASVLGWQGLQWKNEGSTAVTPQLAQSPLTPSASLGASDVLAIAKTSNERQTLLRPDGTSALVAASEPLVMIRNPQLDALLAAHRQLGGVSALQMPAGFLRNTTFEEGPR